MTKEIALTATEMDAELGKNPSPESDVRPPLDDTPAMVDWLLRRYFVSRWDNDLVERLEMILKRDRVSNLLPEGKVFRNERKGVTVTAASQDGKTTMVIQVMKRLFGDSFTDTNCGEQIAYCRLRGDATVKSVCMDLCRTTDYHNFPSKFTRTEANELATHRLRQAGIKIIVMDEVHNLLGKNEPVNLFLKTLAQDGGGFCVILIGTPKVQEFVYQRSENIELAERYLDLPLLPFERAETIELIRGAIKSMTQDAAVDLAPSIQFDPYFADRIYDGCRGSYGRCMFLIANAVIRALEEGGDTVDIEDFRKIFELKYLHFNPENPFNLSDWASRAGAAVTDVGSGDETLLPPKSAKKPARKRGRPRKAAGESQ
ncbi:ATP-binding protein [Puniceibacterium sp. IMCC21224]|uniref:ATP-binding protein n=1 Tax=Puniceibacterium sp. IMCC21224 TaxID=1618204 RepID=UPI00065CF272|nr:ATP-binding protein [Puniceibacterium sp. IMCC21224]KMK67567.1 AAA domain [Puniceibacterium sp. IMCC21224]